MSFEKPSSRQIIVICLLFAAITFGAYICYQTSRNWRKQAEIIVSTMQKMKELVKDNPPSHPDSLEWFNDYVFMNTEVGFSFVGVKQDNSQAVLCDDSCKEWSPGVAKYLASVAKAKKLFNSINGNEYFRKTDHAVYMFIFREPEIADSAPVQDDSNITIKSIIQLFVFVIIILVICYILISKFIGKKSCQKDDNFYGVKDNPSKNEDVNDDENLDSAPTFTCSKEHKAEYERLYDTLCLHGLTKYIAHNNFLLSGKYYKSILPQKYINDAVSDLIKEMFDYLDIIDSNIEIYVSYSNNDRFVKNKDTTGQYSTEDTGTKSITIKVFTDYTYKEVAAIAAHECTHYFAELHKLSVSDTENNERQTDIYAIMLGFGELLYEGYSPNAKSQYSNKNGVNTETTFQNRIGYISSLECLEIMDFIETEKRR